MEQLNKISRIWGISIIILFGLLTFFCIIAVKENKMYHNLESSLVETSKNYIEEYGKYPEGMDILTITIDDIRNVNLDLTDYNNKSCTNAYIDIKQSNGEYEYKAYLKCKNYTTEGYQEY